ncbi:MAG: histidinol dehydrogenase [Chloroflexi bacterium]|nr:histidinol dehydrogenase [Chloroflexota bacterium]
MIKIYAVEEANSTILKRKPLHLDDFAPTTIKRTEAIFGADVTPPQAVEKILKSINKDGDNSVRHWSKTIDNFEDERFSISKEEIVEAYNQLPQKTRDVMEASAKRIGSFHENQPIGTWMVNDMDGSLGQRFSPIESVGVYVPGGTAPLPSSLLMSVIPAQVAGVKKIVVCTPPQPHPSILAAAFICGVDKIYQVGGAQAIAAMAFGTETIPRVDKIVGAGNLFVTLAKQQLYGIVGLDGLAGPTETMVIADATANPKWIAADLLAQAEHDVQASAILLTPDIALAEGVKSEIDKQLSFLSRNNIICVSLEIKGGIVLVNSIDQAAEIANEYAAEHLCLSVVKPEALMEKINNAGGFFLGEHSFEVLGDYIAGPSHVMPTGGTARFSSPLNVLDFVKLSSVIALDPKTAAKLSPIAASFAETEQLTAHVAAARARLEGNK